MATELTEIQRRLVSSFFTRETQAKVTSRIVVDGVPKLHTYQRPTSPIDFTRQEGEYALASHRQKIDFPLSPFYINLRNLPEDLVDMLADGLIEVSLPERPSFVTGIPNAAVPFMKRYAEKTGIPYINVVQKTNVDGKETLAPIEDAPRGNGELLLLGDDVLSTAGSKIIPVRTARELGYRAAVLVAIDRQQMKLGDREKLDFPIYSMLQVRSVFDFALATLPESRFNERLHKACNDYIDEASKS